MQNGQHIFCRLTYTEFLVNSLFAIFAQLLAQIRFLD